MSDYVTYELIEDDVHLFTLLKGGRQALDDIFVVIEKLTREIPQEDTFRILFDTSRTRNVPMQYTIQKVEGWKKMHGALHPTRTAAIAPQQTITLAIVNVLTTIFNTSISKTKLFTPDQWDNAIAWLKADD